jgi:hypothetical protein
MNTGHSWGRRLFDTTRRVYKTRVTQDKHYDKSCRSERCPRCVCFDCSVLIAPHRSVGQRTTAHVGRVEALCRHEVHAAESESPEGL